MTEPGSDGRGEQGGLQQPPSDARRLAADEITRLASLTDDTLHEEMDRNWLAPADPEVYSVWMRLYELGLGDVFLKHTSATPEELEEINLRFELEAAGVTDEDEVESQLDELREQRTPFSERLLAGEFPQPGAGELSDLVARLVQAGLTTWHRLCRSKFSSRSCGMKPVRTLPVRFPDRLTKLAHRCGRRTGARHRPSTAAGCNRSSLFSAATARAGLPPI